MIADRDLHNLITGAAIQQVANDMKDLWKLFAEKLAPLVTDAGSYGGAAADKKDISDLLTFYKETENEIKSFFQKASKAYDPMRIKIRKIDVSTIASKSGISSELLNSTSLSGGFIHTAES